MTITLTDTEADAIIHALEARATALCRARDAGTLTQAEFSTIHHRAWDTYCTVSALIHEARTRRECEASIGQRGAA